MADNSYVLLKLYGEINYDTLTSVDREVTDATELMAQRDCELEIIVFISSNGGSTEAALAIYALLKQYPGPVITLALGPVNSAATIIFLAGDERLASSTSSFMFHDGRTSINNVPHHELTTAVKDMQNRINRMRKLLADTAGVTEQTAGRWLKNGLALTAEEAVKRKIAHRVADESILRGRTPLI